jgi:hypothetical protein
VVPVTAACGAAIAVLWAWTLVGRKAFQAQGGGRLFALRQAAAAPQLAFLTLLAPLALLATDPFLQLVLGAAAGLAFVRYVAADPLKTGFWHHRRLRPVGAAACVTAGAALAVYGPFVALAPLAFAVLVFNRHLRLTAAMTEQNLKDLEAQRQRLVARAAALHEQGVDNLPKAG